MRRTERGFSLIEVMVVMAIIAALAATGTIMIRVAQKKQLVQTTTGRISSLFAGLSQLSSPDQLGYAPPTMTTGLTVGGVNVGAQIGLANDKNIGIETVYAVFRMKGMRPPEGFEDEGATGNTDADVAVAMVGNMQKPDLLEYLDAWGNPLVYFHSRDYKDPSKVERYVLNGTETKVAPKRNPKTNEFFHADTFQLFSVGPDGLPGTEDDIHY